MTTETRKQIYGEFGFFTSLEEAIPFENTEFCLAEMPVGGFFQNKDQIYQVAKYENNTFQMVVKNTNGELVTMDPEINVLYLGRNR